MGWYGVTLERASPGDIYPSYATAPVHLMKVEERQLAAKWLSTLRPS